VLLRFQTEAVKIAAHHVNKRGGVLIGDVVGLGKTLMATAVARIIEIEHGHSTLIMCPVNLMPMWKSYAEQYGLHAKIVPFSKATQELRDVPARFRVVLIDESHNLRNREGQRYRAIQEYIATSGSKVILLSATPYNKTYLDLGSQLRLFVAEDADIGIRPEAKLRDMGEDEFQATYQCPVRSLAAFEKSEFPDDWRELMRLYLVRRTRSFIQQHYSEDDGVGGKCLKFANGDQYHFPVRVPKTVRLKAPGRGAAD
jgi:SNF2 family DNA or RNA helicase